MSDGFLAFKGLGWAAAGLFAVATIMPSNSDSQWNPLRTRLQTKRSAELQRPGLLKRKNSTTTTTTGGGTTTVSAPADTTSSSFSEQSIVPSNFDTSTEVVPALVPPTNSPDVVGAFRFICGPGQVLADDPIVYPGQPGRSHLHQFYGNTGANANSTFESLRTTGQSTCMSPLNRSAYWMPALLDGKGNVVRPDWVAIYYKRRPANDPKCSLTSGDPQAEGNCVPIPNGLKFIFGRDMTNLSAPSTGGFHFLCQDQAGHPIGTNVGFKTMDEALAVCTPGNQFAVIIDAPDCWDGKNLDSADHRSHVAYASRGNWGYLKCPADHSYLMPRFTLGARFTIGKDDDTSKWTFASDSMAPGQPRGSTFHADYFEGWDPGAKATWTQFCIDKFLNCAGGNLGNGTMMKMYSGFSWSANPRLVPIPR